uniref:Methyltransferase type 12 n=1 Tax=Vibrio harveyi TaxID=669 RepID=E5G5F4_VIBHA|nr:methyltransferase type 12 [Vibrio harveyi]
MLVKSSFVAPSPPAAKTFSRSGTQIQSGSSRFFSIPVNSHSGVVLKTLAKFIKLFPLGSLTPRSH